MDEELEEVFVGSCDDLLAWSGGSEEGEECCLRSVGCVDEVWWVRSARRIAACGDRGDSLFRSKFGGHCGAAQCESDREGGVLFDDHGHYDPQRASGESGSWGSSVSVVGALSFLVFLTHCLPSYPSLSYLESCGESRREKVVVTLGYEIKSEIIITISLHNTNSSPAQRLSCGDVFMPTRGSEEGRRSLEDTSGDGTKVAVVAVHSIDE